MKAEKPEVAQVEGHVVKITRPGKILFPAESISKRDLIHYYERVAPYILPHLKGRALVMQRFPDGIDGSGFIQKAAATYYPGWIKKATLKKVGGTVKHVVCDDIATLVYLANQACITPHVWLSKIVHPDFADQMAFDLDPSGDDFTKVISAAHAIRELLEALRLPTFVKATGSRGLHIVVPLDGTQDFDVVRSFAKKLAEVVVSRDPENYTLEQYKSKRRGRVFLDVNRNAYAQTVVAPYAVRARDGAPVAVPLHWSEIDRKGFRPDGVTIRTIFDRLEKIEDPWRNLWTHPASLAEALEKVEKLDAA